MTVRELLLIALVGWTAIGIVGVVVASVRREWVRVRKGLIWLVGVWVAYLARVGGDFAAAAAAGGCDGAGPVL